MKQTLMMCAVLALVGASQLALAAEQPAVLNKCKVCHSLDGKTGPKVGPSLFKVYGRGAAEQAGYVYSPAFMKLKGTTKWDAANLDKYLTSPKTMAPGTKMAFAGLPKADERKAIIDWLKAQ